MYAAKQVATAHSCCIWTKNYNYLHSNNLRETGKRKRMSQFILLLVLYLSYWLAFTTETSSLSTGDNDMGKTSIYRCLNVLWCQLRSSRWKARTHWYTVYYMIHYKWHYIIIIYDIYYSIWYTIYDILHDIPKWSDPFEQRKRLSQLHHVADAAYNLAVTEYVCNTTSSRPA